MQSKLQDLTGLINSNSFEGDTNIPYHIPEVSSIPRFYIEEEPSSPPRDLDRGNLGGCKASHRIEIFLMIIII